MDCQISTLVKMLLVDHIRSGIRIDIILIEDLCGCQIYTQIQMLVHIGSNPVCQIYTSIYCITGIFYRHLIFAIFALLKIAPELHPSNEYPVLYLLCLST